MSYTPNADFDFTGLSGYVPSTIFPNGPSAQATKLSVETVGASNPTAQATRLSTEVLTTTDNPTAQATKLWFELLASVQLAGPAQALTLNVETMGAVTPAVQAEQLWVEVLSSNYEATATVTRLGLEVLGKEQTTTQTAAQEPTVSQSSLATRRWPLGLPGPIADNYGIELQDTALRSAMDTGPGKVRRRFSSYSTYITANWRMTRAQLNTFHSWYGNTLQQGSLTFLWPDPWIKPLWSQAGSNYPAAYQDPGHTHNGTPVPNVNGCCPTHPWVVMLAGDAGLAKLYEIQYIWYTARFRKLNAYKPVGGTRVLESNAPTGYASLALLWEVSAELELIP